MQGNMQSCDVDSLCGEGTLGAGVWAKRRYHLQGDEDHLSALLHADSSLYQHHIKTGGV